MGLKGFSFVIGLKRLSNILELYKFVTFAQSITQTREYCLACEL